MRFAAQRFSSAKRGLSVAWVVLLAVLLVAANAVAQGTGVLTGTVIDTATKRPVGDVVVTASSPALQGEQIVVTDGSGTYRIPNLPPGNYSIRLDKETFRPYQRGGIGLRAEATIRVNVELLPEQVQQGEEIVVTGSAPTVDIGSTTTGSHITSDFTSRIPVSIPTGKGGTTRSFESVAEVTPGAHTDGYGVSISGTTSPENNYVIDGLSVNNTAYGINGTGLSVEFVKEVNVISGGYLPEYGRATGGILDVVTKSGSNEFHGSIFGSFTPGALEGERDKVVRSGQTINTDGELQSVRDFGFDIGGPLVKDKLWFYGGMQVGIATYSAERYLSRTQLDAAGNVVTDDQDNPAVEEIAGSRKRYDVEQRNLQYIGKLSWALNQDNQLSLSVFGAPSFSGGRGNFAILPASGALEANDTNNINGTYGAIAHTYDAISNDIVLKYSSAFKNKKWLLDITLGWHHEDSTGSFGEAADGSEVGSTDGTSLSGIPSVAWNRSGNAEFGYASPHTITDFENQAGLAEACADTGVDMRDLGTDTNGDFVADDFAAGPDGAPDKPQGNTGVGTRCPVFSYNSGGGGFVSHIDANRYQGKAVVTSIFEGAGHHVAKLGFDLELMGYNIRKAYTGGKSYSEFSDGSFFDEARSLGFMQGPDDAVVQRYVDSDNSSTTIGGFIQDSWSILDKVTLNAGVRYDAQMLYNDSGKLGMVIPHQISPRVGAIWDPTQQGKAKIFASFARYHESVPLNIADRALTGDFQIRSRRTPEAGPGGTTIGCDVTAVPPDPNCSDEGSARDRSAGNPVNPNRRWRVVGAGTTPVDADLKPQASDEILVGGEFEAFADARLGASWTHRYMVNIIEDMSVDQASTYFIGNPGQGIASAFPEASRIYDAVTLYLYKTFKNQWLGQASYTISYLRGNYAGLFRPETAQLDPNSNADFDIPVLTQNRQGPLPGDRTHEIKVFGAKDFDLGKRMQLQLGLRVNARSGEPTSVLGAEDVIGYGGDEVFILQRGAGERLPWIFSVDPHVGWGFELGKDSALTLYMDVFNVFNFQGVTRIDDTYTNSGVLPVDGADSFDRIGEVRRTSDGGPLTQADLNPNFGKPTQYQSPRTFRFGGKVTF
ncbi:MAG: TonB-dependent receptor [Polyangiaceae bacterium]